MENKEKEWINGSYLEGRVTTYLHYFHPLSIYGRKYKFFKDKDEKTHKNEYFRTN